MDCMEDDAPDNSLAVVEYLAWKGLAPAGEYVREQNLFSVQTTRRDQSNAALMASYGLREPPAPKPPLWSVTSCGSSAADRAVQLVQSGSGRICAAIFYERPASLPPRISYSLKDFRRVAEVEIPHWQGPLGRMHPVCMDPEKYGLDDDEEVDY